MLKILSIVGARPQFVKASVLRRAFDASDDFHELLLHTGQHYDVKMSDIFFEELDIRKPDIRLRVRGGSHGAMTGKMLEEIEAQLLENRPDACLVYGDTNSTLAGALAASKLHIPVIHIEAGLRSLNKRMPEEINRVLTDHASELLFSPTVSGVTNLKNEGITRNVFAVGDIMYDATLASLPKARAIKEIQGIDLRKSPLAACTIHRAENTDTYEALSKIMDWLNAQCDDYNVVLPLHPRTKNALVDYGLSTGRITTIEPIGYYEMQALLAASEMVFTDSGGLQKEAYFHGKPCVTLRDETEWVELIEAGWNRLWSKNYVTPRTAVEEYGNGQSAALILDTIRKTITG